MRKPAVEHHKAHKSPQWRIVARWPCADASSPGPRRGAAAVTAGQGRGAPPGSIGRGAGFPARRGGPELVFAAVRPGFVAACMVEAASTRGGCRIRVGRPERPPPRCWTVGRDGRRSRVDPTRQAGERRVAALGTRTAVPYSQKQTNGTFDPGCGKPSRRCSAQCGYHCARASRRRGPGIDYLE
jgi:hypothetical protein